MTASELASKLNGREYTNEITEAEEREAKDSGLVVIFGASDDLCELRGAINDEVGAYQGHLLLIGRDGKLLLEIEQEDIEVLNKHGVLGSVQELHAAATKIGARWCATPDYSWTFETEAPHATFDVMEDGEKYCRGIVLELARRAA